MATETFDLTEMTTEEQRAKLNELQEIGYPKLDGQGKALYGALKRELDGDPGNEEPQKEEPKKKLIAGVLYYITHNVLCNGNEQPYKPGDKILSTHKDFEALKASGVIKLPESGFILPPTQVNNPVAIEQVLPLKPNV